MNDQRVAEVHLTGADVASTAGSLIIQVKKRQESPHILWFTPPDAPDPGQPVHYLRFGDTLVEVCEACDRYLGILDQLVRDFLTAHS